MGCSHLKGSALVLDQPIIVEVDACNVGPNIFGAVLLQKFNTYQLNYSTTEQEADVLVWALQHLEVYVGSSPVVVYTDHNPLIFLHSLSCPNRQLMSWPLFLQWDIRHIKGKDSVVADSLSRAPAEWWDFVAGSRVGSQSNGFYCPLLSVGGSGFRVPLLGPMFKGWGVGVDAP